jgi:serine protease inhibitor
MNVSSKGIAAFATLLLGTVACGSDPSTGPVTPITELPRNLSVAEREIIGSSNQFAFRLLRQVNSDETSENVFISPLSVSMALGMAMNGAAGTTFDEMRTTLGFSGLTQEQINDSYRSLIDLLRGLDPTVQMAVGNSVWYRQGFPFEAAFFEKVQRSFDTETQGLDFNSPASITRINDWVSRATNGRIDEIVKEIRPEDVMYLINAIYFKGSWATQFEKSQTRTEAFTGLGGNQISVQMMNGEGTFRYAFTQDYEAIELPYGNTAFTMTILVPRRGADVNTFLTSLDQTRWNAILAGMVEGKMMVALPRFRIEYEQALNGTLKALGMPTAFRPGGADFTGMSKTAGRELYISEVFHKTLVNVDEEGTEAAAVTKVGISVTSAPPTVRVDRPFVFAIRERFSGTLLFTGKIVDPQ